MRFDLHIHSKYSSDSSLEIEDILRTAMNKGLDGIAICDHNTIEGGCNGKKLVKELDLPLIVLPGMEISTTRGHIIVLGVMDNMPQDRTPEETIQTAKQKGGITIAAHPFKFRSIGVINGLDIDAVETFNSRCLFRENERARKMAEDTGKPQVGGSDSHVLGTIGIAYTEIDCLPDEISVLDAIRQGKTRPCGRKAPVYFILLQIFRGIIRRLKRAVS